MICVVSFSSAYKQRKQLVVRRFRKRADSLSLFSIVVRGYWQSSTVFSTFTHTPPSAKSTTLSRVQSPGVASPPTECERAEYHRGYFPGGGEGIELYEGRAERIRREIDGDFALLPGGWNGSATPSSAPSPPPSLHEPTTYDFAFTLPTKTQSNFANPSDDPPYDRGRLMNLPRSPPPSFDAGDGGRTGIVEYIIEVLLRTDEPTPSLADLSGPSEELPSFLASFAANGELSSRGFLRSTPSVLVKRITFPFEPYDRHVDSLDSGWQNGVTKTGAVPSLGRDPRDELTGSKLAEGQGSRGWIDANGGLEKWTTYGKDILLKSGALQRVAARLRCEVSFLSARRE
ncbi:hypothetical protein BCR35DRAFT_185099 [Leucosporidium creatinivorum]|uniref:Uncharacterized protein n=1 Tax=Leucosporidium creatinivorum TaxID=106004 RepID=A0A1Y2DZP9_9BASI|nr:hypothetical protein BCR35DRAFT_185099 [Leucosporidium creatinivorum]